ncbi:MAG: AI-2E family transporter [Lachnospiraceae bacterium]|nr:AI-2E family transporter [Lachnospiraceae bacterium]
MDEQKNKQINEKTDWNIRPYLAMGLISFLVIIGSISFFFLIYRYHGFTRIMEKFLVILQPITIGLVLAYLVNPVVNFEEHFLLPFLRQRMKEQEKARKAARGLSVAGALLFVSLVIGVLLQMVIPELYKSINGMIGTMPRQVNSFMDWISDYVDNDSEVSGYLEIGLTKGTEFFEHWARTEFLPQTKNIVAGLTTGVIGVVRILFNVVIGIIISIYVLMSKEIFIGQSKKVVYALFSGEKANAVIHTVHKSNEIFGGFISGKILDSLIIGILCFICLYFMKMPYSVLVSVIVGVTNVIPFFGPYLGAVPSTILIMLANPVQGLYFVIFILVLQQVDGNIIGPKILGDSTGLSSFWVVFAILVGGGIFGIPGMIIGVPLFAVIFYILRRALNYTMRKKQLPLDSENYIHAERLDLEHNELVNYQEEEVKARPESQKKRNMKLPKKRIKNQKKK